MRLSPMLAMLCLLIPAGVSAQEYAASGRVTDRAGIPLEGVRVQEHGTLNATVTDARGEYLLRFGTSPARLVFSAPGYRNHTVEAEGSGTVDVMLDQLVYLAAIEVVGTRRHDRSAVETPVPVDVIDLSVIGTSAGQLDVNQLLQYVAPSFNATRQSGADGSDHIDPATLRGLGPDQTLVLVNGKRRHQSSMINIFGSRGRGNTGTDLNAIPMAAIERIEILRDGASAQYGSDAIAGVINIVLKSNVEELTTSVSTGWRNASPPSEFAVLRERDWDGRETQVSANYGVRIGTYGFVNATAEYLSKDHTNRPADPGTFDIYRRRFGDAAAENLGFLLNARVPVSEQTAFYAFGGLNFRHTDAFAWSRNAGSDRNVDAIYPNGFDPRITSDIADRSLTAGVRTRAGEWDVDLHSGHGSNRFHFIIDGTVNASLLERSPTRFDAGGFSFGQTTAGVDLSRFLPDIAEGLNVAFGAEARIDRYTIFAGEEGSYRNYGVVDSVIGGVVVPVDTLGRPAGSQGFPGFRPDNELDESRTNVGAYVDAELDVTDRFMVGAAARVEDYSDFGTTLDGKLALRFRVADNLAVRASGSTGFRAPSLAQIHYNQTFTDFVAGVPVDKIIARHGSPITRELGIPPLKEESARNLSAGFTAGLGDFTATVDGYLVDIEDRIVLTGAFDDTDPDIGDDLRALNVGAAQFFTNAIDTRTTGLDLVLSYARTYGFGSVRTSLAANFNEMELGDIRTSPQLAGKQDIYFGQREQYFLRASAPESKVSFAGDLERGRISTSVRVVRFGEVVLADWLHDPSAPSLDVYESRTTTDLALGYRIGDNASITVGGANIFNVYPTQQDTETETGGLWDAVQMGTSGAFYFARLNVRL